MDCVSVYSGDLGRPQKSEKQMGWSPETESIEHPWGSLSLVICVPEIAKERLGHSVQEQELSYSLTGRDQGLASMQET